MRHDKIVAEVLLIFSVVHVAVAAPAVVQQGHLDVGGAASEKRVIWDDEPPSLPRSGPVGFIPRTAPVVPTPLTIRNPGDDETESDDEPLRVPQSRLEGSTGLSPGLPPQLPHPEPVGSDPTAPLTSPDSESESLHLAQPGTSGPHLMHSPSSSVSSNEWFDPEPKRKGVTWAPEEGLVTLHRYTPGGSASNPEEGLVTLHTDTPVASASNPKPKQLKIVHWPPKTQLVTFIPASKEAEPEAEPILAHWARLMAFLGFASKQHEPEAHEASASPESPPASHESPHASLEATHEESEESHAPLEAPAAPNAIFEAPHLHGLPDHLRPRKSTMVRGLANLRDEDLRFLSVLTRRALESLD